MSIIIENEYQGAMLPDYETIIYDIVNAALDYEACPYECQISVTLVDNKAIHQINKEYRGIDRSTDVLSFPSLEYHEAGEFDWLEEEGIGCFDPESGELLLGDIMISMDKVREQAEEYGHSQRREFAFLIAHSMLHLMGYDHMIQEERLIMEKKQEEILQMKHYTRDE
ncbi:MAG: rRNA maturation RNase YbeY [Lachnospiraceae bacterium]|nr:rRNA maturation RNase YbeY [Lachnospiraceae bacterium]